MAKLTFVFALVAALFIISATAQQYDQYEGEGVVEEVKQRAERGFFCNPGQCYGYCRRNGHRRASCSGDECVCL
ncbi:hypothetical protein Zmor_025566 [Zophobas morio]|uniref:Defensin n=1 Tax=Zophobas morio TaxID=2755281 RepID=A0AA38HRQ5_9CUCU|nr:hypothetical protein Zmor_025566 [Zophobas morio]